MPALAARSRSSAGTLEAREHAGSRSARALAVAVASLSEAVKSRSYPAILSEGRKAHTRRTQRLGIGRTNQMARLYRIVAILQLQLRTTSWPVSRQTAPYSSELEPEIVLIEPQPRHAFGVDDICKLGGSITLHSVAAFHCTGWQHNAALGGRIDCIQHRQQR
jgi:hypothetical protein